MIKKIAPVLVAAAVVAGTGTAHAQTRQTPRVMAALGDSISAGFNACGWYVSCTSRSWSAGDDSSVGSHYLRLLGMSPGMRGHNLNFAVPGADSADLAGQARRAVAAGAGYVTILIGAQDACTDSEAAMTPVGAFRKGVEDALAVLRPSGAKVFVASIPDLRRLWLVGKDNGWARSFWALGRVCPSMLAEPSSLAKKDEARRERVRARVIAYNDQLRQACALYGPACRYDGGAVFSYPFTLRHVSGWDYFHPNAEGQRALAQVTFDAGFLSMTQP
ncbi:lipoprotein [Planotetraspora thailandica]|uniref:Lipoprotein n=1 Tax=Planotetraspora thailandica TaxID=487172 RepID=A0A8J3XZM0_9ACTN|nr:SGNH/GDSL hydrolase family protein [Planotetraspora thailandica]GII58075.1 lipoprotein [Planotetraspora thailandica]